MYDLNQIKSRINCVDVAQRCGLPIHRAGDRCVSPLRTGAKNPTSFSVDADFWYDFGSGNGGDCIDLLAEIQYNGDRGAAIRELARITGVTSDTDDRSDGWVEYTNQLNARTAFYHEALTDEDRGYLRSRGLTDADIDRLMIGRVTDGDQRGRLFLPYFSSAHNPYVCYYATRAMPGGAYPDSKYRKQKIDEHCRHIPWGMQTLNRPGDTLIIAEGYFDAASFECQNYPVLSAITGRFSSSQLSMVLSIIKKFSRVLIVYDNDPVTRAGTAFTHDMSDLLFRNRIPFVVGTVPSPYHDVSEYYAAGCDLKTIVAQAQDGLFYIAASQPDFDSLEKFVYAISRYTKSSRMESLQAHLKKTTEYDPRRLDALFQRASRAPAENIVANEIMQKYQLVYINSVGFYEYINGVWKLQPDGVIKSYADRAYGEFSTAQRVSAICNLLKTRALRDVEFNKSPVWNFINGTLELDTGVFRDHNPGDFCSVQAKYPYNPNATCPAWCQFIDDVTGGDAKSAENLQFIPAYALFQDCQHEKIFVLTGSGGNGKTRYLEILRQIFGEENTSYLQPRDLLKDFQRIHLRESIINISGEIRSDLHDVEERMKSIASGEPQSACYKGEQYVTFVPRAKLVFATNSQISSGDTSEGLARRLVIVNFKMKFVDTPDPKDPYQRRKDIHILDKLSEELNSGGIFNWVYAGYKLLKAVGYFTETNDQEELIQDFKRASNPVLLFYEDKIQPTMPNTLLNKALYGEYKQWCIDNGYNALASNWFAREFKNVSERDYDPYRTNSERGFRRK